MRPAKPRAQGLSTFEIIFFSAMYAAFPRKYFLER